MGGGRGEGGLVKPSACLGDLRFAVRLQDGNVVRVRVALLDVAVKLVAKECSRIPLATLKMLRRRMF